MHNFSGHDAIINTLSVNDEGVLFSGGDNGTLTMWDYATGLPFQHLKDIPQPGSLDAEAVSVRTSKRVIRDPLAVIQEKFLTPGCLLLSVRPDWHASYYGWCGQDDQNLQ